MHRAIQAPVNTMALASWTIDGNDDGLDTLRAEVREQLEELLDGGHEVASALVWELREAVSHKRGSKKAAMLLGKLQMVLERFLQGEAELLHQMEVQGLTHTDRPTLPLWMEQGQLIIVLQSVLEAFENGRSTVADLADLADLLEAHRVTASVLSERMLQFSADPACLEGLGQWIYQRTSSVPERRAA